MRDYRPSVILALFNYVEFVTAARAMFRLPQAMRFGVERQALLAALTNGPDFR